MRYNSLDSVCDKESHGVRLRVCAGALIGLYMHCITMQVPRENNIPLQLKTS